MGWKSADLLGRRQSFCWFEITNNTSPRYIAIAAATIDGKIARNHHHNSNWTSREDKKSLHTLLDAVDLVVVGNNTYKLATKPLAKRNCLVFTNSVKTPSRISASLVYFNPRFTRLAAYIKQNCYQRVAILGGASVYDFCLKNNLLDEIYLTIEPVIFGEGLSLFSKRVVPAGKFVLASSKILNSRGAILLRYLKK